METQELLLAAQIRAIAAEIRRHEGAKAANAGQRAEGESMDVFQARFARQHPLTEFVGDAVAELQSIASAMRNVLNQ